jgi:hypothetical protein
MSTHSEPGWSDALTTRCRRGSIPIGRREEGRCDVDESAASSATTCSSTHSSRDNECNTCADLVSYRIAAGAARLQCDVIDRRRSVCCDCCRCQRGFIVVASACVDLVHSNIACDDECHSTADLPPPTVAVDVPSLSCGVERIH